MRLHTSIGDYFLAEKNFELYSKLWEKAKETDLLNVTREMRVFRKKAEASNEKSATKLNDQTAAGGLDLATANADEMVDIDSEVQYLDTLCDGVRLYCKYMVEEDNVEKAVRHADRAVELYDEYKMDSKELKAKVLRWKGISRASYMHTG